MQGEFQGKAAKWLKKHKLLAIEFLEGDLPKILKDPHQSGTKLKGNKDFYSYHFHRRPECRAIYRVENNKVVFVLIATREEVYKDLKNLL